jgi:hypothetical protein
MRGMATVRFPRCVGVADWPRTSRVVESDGVEGSVVSGVGLPGAWLRRLR